MSSTARKTLGSCLAAVALCVGALATMPAGVAHHAESPLPGLPIPQLPIPQLPIPGAPTIG